MAIKKKQAWATPESEATPEHVFNSRRRFVRALGLGTIAGAGLAYGTRQLTRLPIEPTALIPNATSNPQFQAKRKLTREDTVYRYNNFYEFTLSKTAVARKCQNFHLDPWSLTIDGLVDKPLKLDLDDLLKLQVEERVYRFRCVEAWAMTVPWTGLPLSRLLKLAGPQPKAKFALLSSFNRPDLAPRQKDSSFPWPYQEAVTLAEAMNPLAFAAVGLYGRLLQPQNGAPFRVVFPWKYGFKGPKSVVRITMVDYRPDTFWNKLQPEEYGFYGNVNPELSHPRWSQKTESLIGTWGKRVETKKYNGYEQWVGDLYSGKEY